MKTRSDPQIVAQIVFAVLQSPDHPICRKIVLDVADWLERAAATKVPSPAGSMLDQRACSTLSGEKI